MAIKPILFNTEMVQAIMEGRKTQTRRVVKPQPSGHLVPEPDGGCWPGYFAEAGTPRVVNPPYHPGDILWVRETWYDPDPERVYVPVLYKADFPMHWDADRTDNGEPVDLKAEDYRWKSSIHMPKGFARIFLRVKDVWLERLQEITEEQAEVEGAPRAFEYRTPEGPMVTLDERGYYDLGFKAFWDNTVKKADLPLYGWKANPWVWVIEFVRCEKPEGWCTPCP